MEIKFNFKSQVCTSVEQSRRLLSLGLKKETADMHYSTDHRGNVRQLWLLAYGDLHEDVQVHSLPAWSLGRLLALVNGEGWRAEITLKDERYGIHYGYESYWCDDIFEGVMVWIENDIREGYFNKEYLEERCLNKEE